MVHHAGPVRPAAVDRLTGELLGGRPHSQLRFERERRAICCPSTRNKIGGLPEGGGW